MCLNNTSKIGKIAKNGLKPDKNSCFLKCLRTSREVGVNLKQGYNGDLTSRQAGSVGGQMVKKMIQSYEQSIK
ncbi:MAG: alpha/beta-type small acid-soluble spore protein [Ruminococcus sp.]|nr:alpha/beta-type small acid-soluble spore protein [Ruminococcus sp.]